MIIIGVDFHPEFQQIAWVDTDSGEFQEKRLGHREEAEMFYRGLAAAGQKVRVGMEASGHGRWFEPVPEWRSKYLHLMMRRGRKTAKVAMARKLAIRLYWMMRKGWDYEQWKPPPRFLSLPAACPARACVRPDPHPRH